MTGPVVNVSVDTGGNAAWGSSIADLRPLIADGQQPAVPFQTAAATAAAETGVDYLAVGALTHSAPFLDLGMDLSTPSGSVRPAPPPWPTAAIGRPPARPR